MSFYVAAETRGEPPVHPVDEVLPPAKLAVYGAQHVLAFYAGAVIVPILLYMRVSVIEPEASRRSMATVHKEDFIAALKSPLPTQRARASVWCACPFPGSILMASWIEVMASSTFPSIRRAAPFQLCASDRSGSSASALRSMSSPLSTRS